ncbi:MAG TPA: ATP-binding protein, partial [Terriglobales bacterium]|nr:ATP-binding protein [Terriglobales bacterium]
LLLADAIEILIAALGVAYVFGGVPRLNSVKSLAKYSIFAVILAPISVASIAVNALAGDSWWVGFFTEALALLTLTPAILSWADVATTRVKRSNARYLEAIAMSVGLAIMSYFTFVASGIENRPAILYSLMPFLLWGALRFGIAGTSNSLTLVAFLAILGAVRRRGPFMGDTPIHAVLSLQLFLLVAASSFMVLAAVVEDDKTAEQALGESEERLRLAAKAGKMFAYSWDAVTDVMERTGESAEILGVEQAALTTGAAASVTVHPDDKNRLQAAVAKLSVGNPTLQITYRVLRPDGAVIWVDRYSRAYFDGGRNLKRMVGMVVDVTERRRAEEALAGMSRKLIEAQEQERARIGRELHDDINQKLAMLAIELERLQSNPSDVQATVRALRKELAAISNDVQALSHDLHSSKLEYLGVVVGMKSWCREFAERHKLEIDFQSDVSKSLPAEIGLVLFRVLQEALQNVVKHSGVRRVAVQVRKAPGEVHLLIDDSGGGFDLEAAMQGSGLGLTSMRERVRLLNGTITIDSKPHHGTNIRVQVPIGSEQDAHRAAG